MLTATVSGFTLVPLACNALTSAINVVIALFIMAMLMLVLFAVVLAVFVVTTDESDTYSV